MAPQLAELLATAGYIVLSFVSVVLGSIILYVAASLASFLVFFTKESIQNSNRPPITGTVFHQFYYFNTLYDFLTGIARRHPTFRIIKHAHSEILTADPANIEHIFKTSFSKYNKGKFNYGVAKDLFGDGIFTVDGDKWRHQRKLASLEFSTRVLRDFSSDVFRTNGGKLAKKIAEAATAEAVVDMQDLLMKATMDSIFKVGFGVELDTLSGSHEFGSRFSRAFDDSNRIVFWRFADIFWKAKRYLNVGLEAQLKKNIKVIDDFVFQLIRRKREQMDSGRLHDSDPVACMQNGKEEDILSRFIIASKEDPEHMTDQYLRDIILNFLIAGKDTSANTLTWFFYMLCKNPLVQEKIASEIRDATGISESGGGNLEEFALGLSEQVLEKMQYLHASITETLRLFPAVPVDGKCAEEDDVLPDGYKVKKGDGVNYLAYPMGRMTYLWGDDAEEFRPERWIQDGVFRPESPFKFVSFNMGPRICLGKEFAYRQMKILAAVLIHFFRFRLEDPSKAATYRTMFTLHMDHGLPLLVSGRSC